MKIDKSSFLLLAGALAIGACTTEEASDDGPGGTGGGGTGGTAGAAGEAGSGATGGTGGSAGQATGGSAGEAGSGATGGSAGEGGAAGEGGSGGSTCDDSVGTPKACSEVPTDECGEWATDYCDAAVDFLKPAVAEAAVDCMIAITDCFDPNPYDCVADALADACPDATADADCATVVDECGDTLDECHAIMDGLSASGRSDVMDCVNDGCEYGLWSCVESL